MKNCCVILYMPESTFLLFFLPFFRPFSSYFSYKFVRKVTSDSQLWYSANAACPLIAISNLYCTRTYTMHTINRCLFIVSWEFVVKSCRLTGTLLTIIKDYPRLIHMIGTAVLVTSKILLAASLSTTRTCHIMWIPEGTKCHELLRHSYTELLVIRDMQPLRKVLVSHRLSMHHLPYLLCVCFLSRYPYGVRIQCTMRALCSLYSCTTAMYEYLYGSYSSQSVRCTSTTAVTVLFRQYVSPPNKSPKPKPLPTWYTVTTLFGGFENVEYLVHNAAWPFQHGGTELNNQNQIWCVSIVEYMVLRVHRGFWLLLRSMPPRK